MKWSNKGHEFDKYAKVLVENFTQKGNLFYIFGAGEIGEDIREVIEKTSCFSGFIDNDKKKQDSGVNGSKVISLKDYIAEGKKGLIIIAADKKNIPVITDQLVRMGLKKEIDFYEHTEFMKHIFPILSVYANNQLYIELAQISLTERCSLKCKKCAHACYAVDSESQDMSLETAKKSADFFFRYVDIIREFVLIGGEPFLYPNLADIIEYIGENYRDKIVDFTIATNGTIIPDTSILELCRKYHMIIRISDYSAAIKSLEMKYRRLQKKLNEYHVLYSMGNKETQWMDYGFETVCRSGREEELIRVFDKCKTPCREIRGSRYYYCVMARSVSDNLKLNVGKEDYLELADLAEQEKKVILEFDKGYSDKGYLDMCNQCRGAEASGYPIPAAEQASAGYLERQEVSIKKVIKQRG